MGEKQNISFTDADTYGDLNTFVFSCDVSVEGYVDNDQDCDDNNPYANPDGTEVCDGADNDCNSATSEDGMIANADGTSLGRAAPNSSAQADSGARRAKRARAKMGVKTCADAKAQPPPAK